MTRRTLAATGRSVFSLGYGTAWLPRGGAKQAEALIREAIDAGVDYFDTARMYIGGRAEYLLGNVLEQLSHGDRARIVVASKLGILPQDHRLPSRIVRKVGNLIGLQPPAFTQPRRHAFSVAQMEASLATSLRALKTEQIDILLLHGVVPGDLDDAALLFLDRACAAGKFVALGIASDVISTRALIAQSKDLSQIVQIPASPWDSRISDLPDISGSWISHSLFGSRFAALAKDLSAAPEQMKRWSLALDLDLSAPGALADLFVRYAIRDNINGVVLFSTSSRRNLKANIESAYRGPLDPTRLQVFLDLITSQQTFGLQQTS